MLDSFTASLALVQVTGKDKTKGTVVVPLPASGLEARHVRITFKGVAGSGSDRKVALQRVRLAAEAPSDGASTSALDALAALRGWITTTASGWLAHPTPLPASGVSPLAALLDAARVTGSAQAVLATARLLLSHSQRPLDKATAARGEALLAALRTQVGRQRTTADAAEYTLPVQSFSAAAGPAGPSFGPLPGVEWDATCKSDRVAIEAGNRIRSETGDYMHCLVSLGASRPEGFKSGKVAWTMKLIEDTDSQVWATEGRGNLVISTCTTRLSVRLAVSCAAAVARQRQHVLHPTSPPPPPTLALCSARALASPRGPSPPPTMTRGPPSTCTDPTTATGEAT